MKDEQKKSTNLFHRTESVEEIRLVEPIWEGKQKPP